MQVVEMNFGHEQMDSELVQSILKSVEQSKKPLQSDEQFPDFLVVGIGMGVCMLWTALTLVALLSTSPASVTCGATENAWGLSGAFGEQSFFMHHC